MNSLRVDEDLLVALADGDPRARAIAASWKFREPVTLMPSAELDALSERCRTTFNFSHRQEITEVIDRKK